MSEEKIEETTRETLARKTSLEMFSKLISKSNVKTAIQTINRCLNGSVTSNAKRNLHILNLTWRVAAISRSSEDVSEGFSKLIKNQFRLLQGTMSHDTTFQSALKMCAKNIKTSKNMYLKVLSDSKDVSESEKALACYVMSFEMNKDEPIREKLLEWFANGAVESSCLQKKNFNPFQNLLRTIDHKDFATYVEPVVRSAFSKAQYGLIENIISSMKIDLSRYVKTLFVPGLETCLVVSSSVSIEASIGIAKELYPRCSDIDSLCSSLNSLTEKVRSSFLERFTKISLTSKTLPSSSSSKNSKSASKTTKSTTTSTGKKKKKKDKKFGFSAKGKKKDKKKKTTSKKKEEVKKVVGVVENNNNTTGPSVSEEDDESLVIVARVYMGYLLAARATLKKLGNVAKDTMHDMSLKVVRFLTQIGGLALCTPITYAIVLSEYVSLFLCMCVHTSITSPHPLHTSPT